MPGLSNVDHMHQEADPKGAGGMTKIASTADAQGLRRGDIAVAMG
jgi:hypothetical protein